MQRLAARCRELDDRLAQVPLNAVVALESVARDERSHIVDRARMVIDRCRDKPRPGVPGHIEHLSNPYH